MKGVLDSDLLSPENVKNYRQYKKYDNYDGQSDNQFPGTDLVAIFEALKPLLVDLLARMDFQIPGFFWAGSITTLGKT